MNSKADLALRKVNELNAGGPGSGRHPGAVHELAKTEAEHDNAAAWHKQKQLENQKAGFGDVALAHYEAWDAHRRASIASPASGLHVAAQEASKKANAKTPSWKL